MFQAWYFRMLSGHCLGALEMLCRIYNSLTGCPLQRRTCLALVPLPSQKRSLLQAWCSDRKFDKLRFVQSTIVNLLSIFNLPAAAPHTGGTHQSDFIRLPMTSTGNSVTLRWICSRCRISARHTPMRYRTTDRRTVLIIPDIFANMAGSISRFKSNCSTENKLLEKY